MESEIEKLRRELAEAKQLAEQARQEVRDLRIERHVAQNQRDAALKTMATYGGIEDLLCPEFEGVDDLVECFRLLKEQRDRWKAMAEELAALCLRYVPNEYTCNSSPGIQHAMLLAISRFNAMKGETK